MKKLIVCALALLLTACNCVTVATERRVTGKVYEPSYTSICMTTQVGNIPMHIPLHGGVCSGPIEMIPAKYYLVLDDGQRVQVGHQTYAATKEGDPYMLENTVCD